MTELPAEILSYIFILYTDSRTSSKLSSIRHASPRMSIVLGGVCSYWRQVSFATPQLWTMINIKSSHNLDHFDLRSARTCFSHCGDVLPLTVHVVWDDLNPETAEDQEAFKILVIPYSPRSTNMIIQLFLKIDGVGALMDTMQGFTSLTLLEFSLPSSFTTQQAIAEGGNPDWKATLKACGRSSIKSITLPALQHLSLNFESCRSSAVAVIPILKSLVLPSLSSFTLRMNVKTDEDDLAQVAIWCLFAKLLQKSKPPPIRHIYSSKFRGWDDTVLRILLHAPYLEEAHNIYFGVKNWEALALTVPSPRSESSYPSTFKYAPNLTTLYINQIPRDRVDSLIQVLSSRWRGGEGPLKKVIVTEHVPNFVSRKFLDLAKAQLNGLEVVELGRDDSLENVH